VRVRFRREAAKVRKARNWYTERDSHLGNQFVAAVDAAVDRASSRPLAFPVIPRVRTVRRAQLRGFPFLLLFRVLARDVIEVLAVAHMRRRPNYWRPRLRLARHLEPGDVLEKADRGDPAARQGDAPRAGDRRPHCRCPNSPSPAASIRRMSRRCFAKFRGLRPSTMFDVACCARWPIDWSGIDRRLGSLLPPSTRWRWPRRSTIRNYGGPRGGRTTPSISPRTEPSSRREIKSSTSCSKHSIDTPGRSGTRTGKSRPRAIGATPPPSPQKPDQAPAPHATSKPIRLALATAVVPIGHIPRTRDRSISHPGWIVRPMPASEPPRKRRSRRFGRKPRAHSRVCG